MPIPYLPDPPARLLCDPVPSDVEPTALAAMPHPSSGSPSPPSRTPRLERPAWDAALRPAQQRAGLRRARLEQRRLADARRQRLIMGWLRELANR